MAAEQGLASLRAALGADASIKVLLVEAASLAQMRGQERGTGRRDAALYAMNYGTAYVASVAHYASYAHALGK